MCELQINQLERFVRDRANTDAEARKMMKKY
jgi:hypothetical protein